MSGCGSSPPASPTSHALPAATATAPAPQPPSASRPASRPAPRTPTFVDITQQTGVDFVHFNGVSQSKTLPETMGAGGGFLDFDCNHRPDILLINGGPLPGQAADAGKRSPRLYLNNSDGTFSDATEAVGLAQVDFCGMAFAAADYDHDSDIDLFLTGVGRCVLLLNEGGVLVDATASLMQYEDAGAAGGAADWSTAAAWLDFDLDHKLDLFVCNYAAWSPQAAAVPAGKGAEAYPGQTCRLFQNVGEGRLVEVTRSAGLFNPRGRSLSVVVDDLNRDFRPDLIVTNDGEPNFAYQRSGVARFEEMAAKIGFAPAGGPVRSSRGVDSCEWMNNGMPWIAIGAAAGEPLSLMTRSDKGAAFENRAAAAGLPPECGGTFGLVMADVDLDGFADLVVARDAPRERAAADAGGSALKLFRGDGGGGFADISGSVGPDFNQPGAGRGLAYADIDNDGDLDLLLTVNGGRPRLLRNDLPAPPNVVRVTLRGAWQEYDGIGCQVRCRVSSGESYTCMFRTGGSYLSQSELAATFVIGGAPGGAIDVRWPSGFFQTAGVLQGGATYVVGEGRGGVIETLPFQR